MHIEIQVENSSIIGLPAEIEFTVDEFFSIVNGLNFDMCIIYTRA